MPETSEVTPRCPAFGRCGGCQYQDRSYADQLALKEQELRQQLTGLHLPDQAIAPIVPSPVEYGYRHRLDIKLLRTRSGEIFTGFTPSGPGQVLPVTQCPIALPAVSDFLPELKRQASARLPPRYRIASLVVKSGDDGRVAWGGIGRRSLRLAPEDYFYTEVEGRRIFFGLDTFFQANLAILPSVMQTIRGLGVLNPRRWFFDLYGGVGLFGLCLYDDVAGVTLVEENVHAVRYAEYNRAYHGLTRFELAAQRLEDVIGEVAAASAGRPDPVAMIDPPRAGLSSAAAAALSSARVFTDLLYLSCHPESLCRDLLVFQRAGWSIVKVVPFDFFPQTRHVETLVHLKPEW